MYSNEFGADSWKYLKAYVRQIIELMPVNFRRLFDYLFIVMWHFAIWIDVIMFFLCYNSVVCVCAFIYVCINVCVSGRRANFFEGTRLIGATQR